MRLEKHSFIEEFFYIYRLDLHVSYIIYPADFTKL